MQPKRVVSKANASAVFGCLLVLSCTGYVQPREGDAPVVEPIPGTAAAPSASGTNSAAGSKAAASAVAPAAWTGSVGSWCGPVEEQTLWLNARPQAAACEVVSQKLYSAASEDTAEGLTLKLDPQSLGVLPTVLRVPARYCAAGATTCSDVQASLSIDSYTPGQGIRGSWTFTPPGQAELRGQVDASWCNWDDFLPAHPEAERLARDIEIKEVSVYQGVKVPIVRDAQAVATRNADLVQQRESLLRVFVEPAPGFQSRAIAVRVTLQDEAEKPRHFEQIINVSGPSKDEDGASTFNLELPKDAFNPGTQYSVELRETSRCTALAGIPVGARFPEQGMAPVGARRTGPIKVMLVPVRYEADGSGRLPDTSPEQLQQMTKRLYSMYPTTEVMLSVRNTVATDRTDLSDMLDQMRELRAADAPPSDLSYYGLVRQAETFGDYCQGTCTTGIAGFGSMNGTAAAGMGVGFPETAAGTFVHELGHIYRRPHAPCGGAGAPDESYPYPNAGLGSWGYDFQTRELFDPTTHVDFMSYCSPDWISDYNYQQILERIVVMNQRAFSRRITSGTPPSYRTLRVAHSGQARWGLDLGPQLDPPGDPIKLKALDTQGSLVELSATFEDGPDGEQSYFVPAGQLDWQAIQVPGGPLVPYSDATQNKPFQR
jgi:hypothetical protein